MNGSILTVRIAEVHSRLKSARVAPERRAHSGPPADLPRNGMPRGRWRMGFKTPEEELEEFLAARPSWARKVLQADYFSLTVEEEFAFLHGNWDEDLWNYSAEYERLCQRVPARWHEYCNKKQQALTSLFFPSAMPGRPGRPRKDWLAEQATLLHQSGKSYGEIADLVNEKYGLGTTTREAIRKLVSPRKHSSKPEKT